MTGTVLFSCAHGVATVTLNRPARLNAINAELLADFKAALAAAQADEAINAIILCGAGRAFCSGDDLKDFDDQLGSEVAVRRYIESIQDITRAIVLGDRPVVGAIHGWAVGGGLEWMINCDFPILAEGTRCFFPEIRWGLFPTGAATRLLPQIVGPTRARAMLLFSERFDAAAALATGLAWKVVAEDERMAAAEETARRIAELPPAAVRDLKRALARAAAGDVEAALARETEATVRGFLDPASAARVRRFAAKD